MIRNLLGRLRRSRSRTRVVVVPGVLGSRLGLRGTFVDDTIWLDPLDIGRGHLDRLALGDDGKGECEALGILPFAYLRIVMSLRAQGYAVETHAYDWRRGVAGLGRELADRIQDLRSDDVRIVGHSFGGLLARAALAAGAPGVTRVVTLGTPHQGAFATLQVLRGHHPIVQRVAAIDPRRDPESLARRIFATFPGTYAILPHPPPGAPDPCDPASWPERGVPIRAAMLDAARREHRALAPPDSRFVAVAGTGFETPLGAEPTPEGFRYPMSSRGDGIVPIESAVPEGVPGYYIEGGHGLLPSLGPLLEALPDLLDGGSTDRLATRPPPARPLGTVGEVDLEAQFATLAKALERPSPQALQALVAEFAAPAPSDDGYQGPGSGGDDGGSEEAGPVAGTPGAGPVSGASSAPAAPKVSRDAAARLAFMAQAGEDPNGYALLQPGMEYWDHPLGFAGYRTSLWTPVVLGDPCCRPSDRATVLSALVAARPKAVFFNLSEAAATDLSGLGLGYRFAPMGTERYLDLATGEGFEAKTVKSAVKKAKKAGLELDELDWATASPERLLTLAEVNREFLAATPAGREITFVSRGVALAPEPEVRVFVLSAREGETARDFGFLVLDPWWQGGVRVGYQLNAIRFRRTRIWGVYFAVVAMLADLLRAEGSRFLSLGGLAYDLVEQPSAFPHDPKMLRRLAFVRERTDEHYVMSHFTSMKVELGGTALRRYIALPARASVTRSVLRFLRVSGMV